MATGLFSAALVLCLCLAYVKGQEVCSVTGKGQLLTYASPKKVNIKMPCKYQFSWNKCGKDEIRIIPGQAYDFKYRYFTNTLWVKVVRPGTSFSWEARTGTKRVVKYLEDPTSREPFNVKESQLIGAPFSMKTVGSQKDQTVTLTPTDGSWKIVFKANDESDAESRKTSGITFYCPNAEFMEESMYPQSICGNDTDSVAIKNRKKEIGTSNLITTAMYDILLNEDIVQTNPYCQSATSILSACPVDKADVVNKCSKIVNKGKVIKCLSKFHYDPMDQFNNCLKYHCNNDVDACEELKVAMDGCPKVPGVPTGQC